MCACNLIFIKRELRVDYLWYMHLFCSKCVMCSPFYRYIKLQLRERHLFLASFEINITIQKRVGI